MTLTRSRGYKANVWFITAKRVVSKVDIKQKTEKYLIISIICSGRASVAKSIS